MKKKLLFLVLAVMAFAFVFALTAMAKTSTSTLEFSQSFGEAITTSDIGVGSVITDTTARVVFDDGKTYPSYYIVADQATFATTYDAINTAFSTGYSDANVVRIEIPEGITTITADYFKNATKMSACEEVVIPDSVTSLSAYVFAYNTVIKSVTTSAKVDHIPNQMFERAYGLEEFIVPEDNVITYVGYHAFGMSGGSGTPSLKRIDNLTNVVTIKYNAFISCTTLEWVELGNKVKTIEYGAFQSCTKLELPAMSPILESVGDDAFKNCQSITSLVFPENCSVLLESYQFENCKKLHTLIIKSSPTTALGEGIFKGCSSLKTLELPKSQITAIGANAFNGAGLEFISLDGTQITSLPNHVFANCSGLKKVILPESVTSIGNYCLEKCTALEEVWMPNQTALAFGAQVFGQIGSEKAVNFYFPSAICTVTFSDTTVNKDPFMTAYYGSSTSATIAYSEPLTTKCTSFYGAHTTPAAYNNCTEGYTCVICATAQSAFATEHDLLTTVTYENGFAQAGEKLVVCQNCAACTVENEETTLKAIFVAKGYSYKDGANGGISGGFYVNRDLVKLYKDANPGSEMTVSLIMVNPKYLTTDSAGEFLDANGMLTATSGAMQIDISDLAYENYDYTISGFNLELMQNLELAFAIVICDGEGIEVVQKQYADGEASALKNTYEDINGITLNTVTVESIAPSVVAEIKSKEEII